MYFYFCNCENKNLTENENITLQHFASCLPRKSMERQSVDVSHKRRNKERVSRGHLRIGSFHYRRDQDLS